MSPVISSITTDRPVSGRESLGGTLLLGWRLVTTQQRALSPVVGAFQSLDIRSSGFELCAEINSKLLRRGVDILEVPISYQPRNAAAGKKIRLRDFFIAAWTYVRYRFAPNNNPPSGENVELAKPKPIYLISRVLIGCLLLVAGVTKLSPLSALPIATWLVLPEAVVFSWGVVEFILGWACLTFVPHRLLRQVLTGLFSLFLVVLAVQWFNGEERCQCLGSLSVPVGCGLPTLMAGELVSIPEKSGRE